MSSTRVLLLGVLLDGPMHGYKIRQTLELWGAQHWANVKYGSIYHGLAKMAEEGLLAVVEGGTGGQVRYEITEDGRREFQRLLAEYWWELKPVIDPFQVAVTFMNRMSQADLLAALRARRDLLRAALLMNERALAAKSAHGAPRHIEETIRLADGQVRIQLEWVESTIKRVEAGELP